MKRMDFMTSRLALVTGATGYVGGQVAAELVERGWRVRVLSRSEKKVRALPWGEHVEVVVDHKDISLDSPFAGDLVERMRGALLAEDPEAAILPYCLSGGTDNKALAKLGITGYGFAQAGMWSDGAVLAFAVGVFALQLVAARWYTERFRYGPVEWVLRVATYGGTGRMRAHARATVSGRA